MLHSRAGRPQDHLAQPAPPLPLGEQCTLHTSSDSGVTDRVQKPDGVHLPAREVGASGGHTQIAVHDLAVVHLPPHGSDLLQLVFLGFHSFFQFLKLFIFRNRLLLMALLLL